LRFVIPGRGDAVDLFLIDGCWTSDRGVRVEIGALLAPEGVSLAHFLPARARVRTLAAV
jgi:hypothetical protein